MPIWIVTHISSSGERATPGFAFDAAGTGLASSWRKAFFYWAKANDSIGAQVSD